MSGPNANSMLAGGQAATFGTQGVESAQNVPAARQYTGTYYDISSGTFYLFGGYPPTMGDIWSFSSSTLNWTWIGGQTTTNGPGVIDNLNVELSSSKIGCLWGSSIFVDDSRLFVFGGRGYPSSTIGKESARIMNLPCRLYEWSGAVFSNRLPEQLLLRIQLHMSPMYIQYAGSHS